MPTHDDKGVLGQLVPPQLQELLRSQTLILSRPVLGRRHGRHASRRAGMGLDFRDHRPYVPGDEPRMLDWRAVARRDRLVLRQTESEDELDLVLLVDGSGGMAYGEDDLTKMDVARALAGSLAWLAVRQGDRMGFAAGSKGEFELSSVRPSGSHRLTAMVRALGGHEPAGTCPWPELLSAVEPRLPRRSLLVLISDFLDPAGHHGEQAGEMEQAFLRGLGRLRARDHDVVLLQVLHPDELTFPWSDRRMLRFEDLRTTRPPIEAPGGHLRKQYLERLRRHLEWLRSTCERSGLLLHGTTTDRPLSDALMALLSALGGTRGLHAVEVATP